MLFDQVKGELELTERHLLVLKKVIESEPIGILKLSEETNMPTHKVRYSLRVLEQERLIKPSAHGAVVGEDVKEFLSSFENEIDGIMKKAKLVREIGKSIE
ncbi:MAG: hypothetical protein JXA38_03230 [Methanosarcinaceae archaeon]|nr:hypothetical protein [Methanosarcinaceae archaeon]